MAGNEAGYILRRQYSLKLYIGLTYIQDGKDEQKFVKGIPTATVGKKQKKKAHKLNKTLPKPSQTPPDFSVQ